MNRLQNNTKQNKKYPHLDTQQTLLICETAEQRHNFRQQQVLKVFARGT